MFVMVWFEFQLEIEIGAGAVMGEVAKRWSLFCTRIVFIGRTSFMKIRNGTAGYWFACHAELAPV